MQSEVTTVEPILVNGNKAQKTLGNVSEKHLYNLRKLGKLSFVKVGHRIMYRPESLREFARTNEELATVAD